MNLCFLPKFEIGLANTFIPVLLSKVCQQWWVLAHLIKNQLLIIFGPTVIPLGFVPFSATWTWWQQSSWAWSPFSSFPELYTVSIYICILMYINPCSCILYVYGRMQSIFFSMCFIPILTCSSIPKAGQLEEKGLSLYGSLKMRGKKNRSSWRTRTYFTCHENDDKN